MVVVVPGVGPQQTTCARLSRSDGLCGRISRLSDGALRCQARQLALLRHAGDALDERAGERAGEDRVGERRSERAAAGEPVGKAEDVVVQRVQAPL